MVFVCSSSSCLSSSFCTRCPPPQPILYHHTRLALKPLLISSLRVVVSDRAILVTGRHGHRSISASLKSCVNSDPCPESEPSPENDAAADASSPPTEVTFDIKLPRRNLSVQFSCNSCGERTKRIINRLAYERGTVFVQCAGCLVNHKLVDNLGLVVEYDLREDASTEVSVVTKQD